MAIVNVVLPGGATKKGEVDETAPVAQIKEEIMASLAKSLNPNDYNMVHLPQDENIAYSNYTIRDGDTFIIQDKRSSRGKAWNEIS